MSPRAPIKVKAVSRIFVSSTELHMDNGTTPTSNPCPPTVSLSVARLFDRGIELGAGEHDGCAEVKPHQQDHHRTQRADGNHLGIPALVTDSRCWGRAYAKRREATRGHRFRRKPERTRLLACGATRSSGIAGACARGQAGAGVQPCPYALARTPGGEPPPVALSHLPHWRLTFARIREGGLDNTKPAQPAQHRGEMGRRRAVQPFEPILIEKRGERRLAERRLP